MKNFVFITYGFVTPTQEIMEAWGNWFASISDKMVDSGTHFGPGREITHDGTEDLPLGLDSITGILTIKAENLDEAEQLAQSNPYIASIRVYEIM